MGWMLACLPTVSTDYQWNNSRIQPGPRKTSWRSRGPPGNLPVSRWASTPLIQCCSWVAYFLCLFGMYLCRREFIARPILPALSLHALSTLAVFTCRFHYPRNPYDVLYTLFSLFPLLAQSIPPKWPLPADWFRACERSGRKSRSTLQPYARNARYAMSKTGSRRSRQNQLI